MPSYDSLNGVRSYSDFDLNQIVASSYINFLDWGLINIGAFNNVKINNQNINSADMSKLRPVTSDSTTKTTIWEVPKKNLVWESGVANITKPINISGLYVNNTFMPNNGSSYNIDYPNGRVIFNSGIIPTSTIKMEYSYKINSILEARECPHLRQLQFRSFDPYNNNFTQYNSGEYSKTPEVRIQFPVIGIDVVKQSSKPYELGNLIKRIYVDVDFHFLGETDAEVKKNSNILVRQKEGAIFLLDLNLIAKSGAFPLNSNGYLTNPMTYPNLVAEGRYRYSKSTMIKADATEGQYISNNLYHRMVHSTLEIIYQ
jgi:hypothetical protein